MSISQVLVILLRRGWIVVLALLTTMIVAGSVLLWRLNTNRATRTKRRQSAADRNSFLHSQRSN